MALTPPTTDDLALHQHVDEVDNEDWAEDALQLATDLMALATGITEYPSDPVLARVVRKGILDMAWYLTVQSDNKAEKFTPFTSETIGSYSYSKQMYTAVRKGADTGVDLFDLAVSYLLNAGYAEPFSLISSEFVFNPTGETYAQQEAEKAWENLHDPTGRMFFS